MPQPPPAPGMSFAYNLPCLLPLEEGAPVRLSPPTPFHLGVAPMEHSSPPHFETKKTAPSLLPGGPRGEALWVGAQEVIAAPGVTWGPWISPGGLAAAGLALHLPLVILSSFHVHSPPQEMPWYPLWPPRWSSQPSLPTAPQPRPSPARSGAREPTVPTRTGPCPAARLGDGHLMPISPPPVPVLVPPPTWGGVQLPLTG